MYLYLNRGNKMKTWLGTISKEALAFGSKNQHLGYVLIHPYVNSYRQVYCNGWT